MAQERYIHGKKDDKKHDGLYSIRKREAESEQHLQDYLSGELDNLLDNGLQSGNGNKPQNNQAIQGQKSN